MNNQMIENAYIAQVKKLVYPSLKYYLDGGPIDVNKILKCIQALKNNQDDDDFPVISLLYHNCQKSKAKLNQIEIDLIDEDLIKSIEGSQIGINQLVLKELIIQEINYFCKRHHFERNTHFIQLKQRREVVEDALTTFWLLTNPEFEAISNLDLQLFFRNIESITEDNNFPEDIEFGLRFNYFREWFLSETRMQRHYLLKILSELDYSQYVRIEQNFLNFQAILDYLNNNGLSKSILDHYEIHVSEIKASIYLKLLQDEVLQDQYEFETNQNKTNLKNQAEAECKNQLENFKLPSRTSYRTQPSSHGPERVNTREEGIEALKDIVDNQYIGYLNTFLVDLWLINNVNVFNNDYTRIEDLRNEFMSGETIKIKSVDYSYLNFEKTTKCGEIKYLHFLDSKIAKQLREESNVKTSIEKIRTNTARTDYLYEFLNNNKNHFKSYGSNVFIYEKDSIKVAAQNISRIIKASKAYDAEQCHTIIKTALKSLYAVVSIRYSASRREYDGLGNFGGFAHEVKYLKVKENDEFVASEKVIDKLNELIEKDNFEDIVFIYNEKRPVRILRKDDLFEYLKKFNDLELKDGKVEFIEDENKKRYLTAKLASNKKFDAICNDDEKNLLMRIMEHEDKDIKEENILENNGNIKNAGTNRKFIAENFKYDISSVYSLGVNGEDFYNLSEQRSNVEDELSYVTTNQKLSIFELIQRFGYSMGPHRHVTFIGSIDEYKTYAYKYPHEYFGGPIALVKKVFDEVIKLNQGETEMKDLRLWLYAHLFTAAQIDILDIDNPKLKQSIKIDGKKREYSHEKFKTQHYLNFKKYFQEDVADQNEKTVAQKKQDDFIKKFFGDTITIDEFEKLQSIIKDVYEMIADRNSTRFFQERESDIRALINDKVLMEPLDEKRKKRVKTETNYYKDVIKILKKHLANTLSTESSVMNH